MFDTVSRLERSRQRNPGIPLFARLAEEYLNRGDLDRALALCREGCEQFPAYPTGFFILSRCLESADELEEARAALDKALRLDPDNPGGFARLSDLYLQLGVGTLALKCLEHASSLDPFDLDLAARSTELARSIDGSADGTAAELPVESSPDDGKAEEVEEESGVDEAVSPGEEDVEVEEGADSAFDTLEETFASSFDDTIIGASKGDEPERSGGLDPQGAEPFAAVEPLPEWDELDAAAETPADAPPAAEPLPAGDVKAHGYDEVAALGAELFGEEEIGNLQESVPGASPDRGDGGRVAEDVVTAGAESSDAAGDELDALLSPDDPLFSAEESDDDELIGAAVAEPSSDEFDNGPEAPDPLPVEPVSAGQATDALDEGSSVDEGSSSDDEDELIGNEPTPVEAVSLAPAVESTSRGVGRAAHEAEPPVSRLTTRDDAELIDLFHEIGARSREGVVVEGGEPTGSSPRAANSGFETEPIPTVTLAELYTRQGFAERAMVTYRQILAVEPDNEEVKSKLSNLERSW